VHKLLLAQQNLFAFHVVLIGHTAIHGTNRSALWFFMEAFALRAFVRYNIIDFVADGFLNIIGINGLAIGQYHIPF
jgi:hypothetical protein